MKPIHAKEWPPTACPNCGCTSIERIKEDPQWGTLYVPWYFCKRCGVELIQKEEKDRGTEAEL